LQYANTHAKANGKEYSAGFFRTQNAKLGHSTLKRLAMGVEDGLIGHKTLSGFLGGNVLENFVVTIDYEMKQLILTSAFKHSGADNLIMQPMTVRTHRPYSTINLNGKLDVTALIDTGCPFNMSADWLSEPILSNKLSYKQKISGPWLGSLNSECIQLDSLGLGAASFKGVTLHVFPAAEAPQAAREVVLGNDFLRRFKAVTFDYPGRRVILEPR
jgi:hypothetical protein